MESGFRNKRNRDFQETRTPVGVVGGLVGLLLGGNFLLLVVGVAVGWLLPKLWLGRKRKRRLKAFNAQLADTLQLISGSLAAGMSLAQSVDTVVREGQEPVAGEFKRVLVETRLGVSLDDAMQGIAERLESADFAWVVMAIRIQRVPSENLGGGVAARLIAIVLALVVAAVVFSINGADLGALGAHVLKSTFGSRFGLMDLGLIMTPLILTGLAVMIAMKVGAWR